MRTACCVALITILALASTVGRARSSRGSDGEIDVLLLFANPYGANTHLLKNQFEDLGWNLTMAGLTDEVRSCSSLCVAMAVDALIPDIDVSAYDAVVLATTQGAFHYSSNPAREFRESPETLDLIREADRLGLTLFSGCASTLVLAEAGVLEGRSVLAHARVDLGCDERGIVCTESGSLTNLPPLVDGNIVTGTNHRLYQAEIAEAIARSFEESADGEAHGPLVLRPIELATTPIESDHPIEQAFALGGSGSDIVRAACPADGGAVLVGQTYSVPDSGPDALIVKLSDELDLEWAVSYGGPGRDLGSDVCVLSDGGILIVGTTSSIGGGREDVLLVKLDPSGVLLWSKTLGGAESDVGLGVCATDDGGFAACGFTHPAGEAHSDVYVIRGDGDGHTLWTRSYGDASFERGVSIAALADGGFAIAGGSTSRAGHGNYDMLLLRVDATGEPVFEEHFGGSTYDLAEDVIVTRAGGFAIAGFGDTGADIMDARIVVTDAAGQRQERLIRGEMRDLDYARAIIEQPTGGFLIAGRTNAPTPGRNDAWLLAMGPDGGFLWEQAFGGSEGDGFRGLCSMPDGRYLAVGYTTSFGSGSYDALVAVIDAGAIP